MKKHSRLTVDMNADEHMYLKMTCAKLGVPMREFMIKAAFEKIEGIEDVWLAERANETLRRIEAGEEKTSPWTKVKKRVS